MLFRTIVFLSFVAACMSTCSDSEFLTCVIRLKAQGAPFGRNIMKLVFDLETEAKLLHTCRVYSDVLPCFREKIDKCGNTKQKRIMKEVGSVIMYLCSPFSLQRQKLFMSHRQCISSVLNQEQAQAKCNLSSTLHGRDVQKCKDSCALNGTTDIVCMVNSWASEQNVCTLNEIEKNCGSEATGFYTDIQKSVFDPMFPIICQENMRNDLAPSDSNKTNVNTVKEPLNRQTIQLTTPKSTTKIYSKVTKPITHQAVASSPENIAPQQYAHMPARKLSLSQEFHNFIDENLGTFESQLNKNTETTKTTKTYRVYNLIQGILQSNIHPQFVNMIKSNEDKLNINWDLKNAFDPDSFLQNLASTTPVVRTQVPVAQSVATTPTPFISTTRVPLYAHQALNSKTEPNMKNYLPLTTNTNQDNSKQNEMPHDLHRKEEHFTKWRPWYLDGH